MEREGYDAEFYEDDDPDMYNFQESLIGTDPLLESLEMRKLGATLLLRASVNSQE